MRLEVRPISVCKRFGRPTEAGFSLLELMIAMTLLGTFVVAVYWPFTVGLRLLDSTDKREDIRQQLANALGRLTREASLASNVRQAKDQQFKFDADLDGNGTTENNIDYQVNSGDLERVYGGTTVTLVGDLTTIDFDYVDLNGASMPTNVVGGDRNDIRVVQITITATKDDETISLASAVFLRNNN